MRRRHPALVLLLLAAVLVLSAALASTAAALPTFTMGGAGIPACETCHGGAPPGGVHAIPAHAGIIGNCATCHTVNTATPPLPSACANPACHGAVSVILTAHEAPAPGPNLRCATTPGCHGATAGATITAVTPAHAVAGANVTITGTGFGATQGAGTVMFGTTTATVVSWSATSIVVTVPASLSPGAVDVVVTPAVGTASAAFSFTVDTAPVDTVAPVVTFTGVVNGKWYNTSKTIVFTATDAGGSGVASITTSVNSGTPVVTTAATASVTIDVDRTTHADDGVYVVTYFATDVAGNVAASKTVTVKIDTRKPGTIALSKVKVVQGQTVRLSCKVTDEQPTSGKASVTIKIKTRGGKTVKTVKLGVRPVNKVLRVNVKANLKPGTYKYFVYAKDIAGNSQANVASKAFIVLRARTGGFNG